MAHVYATKLKLSEAAKKDLAWLVRHGYYADALEIVHSTIHDLTTSRKNDKRSKGSSQ